MILPDSSVWIAHLRRPERTVQVLLDAEVIVGHPYVLIEVALGSIADRAGVIAGLRRLPQAAVAPLPEVAELVEAHPLWSRGIGFADASLLASVRLMPGTRLWTRDRRLRALAAELSIAADLD